MALLNLDWHTEHGHYCDGPVEDEMLDMVQERRNLERVVSEDNRWPILYHFSPDRRNLLEWFQFEENASLLEIGAGCGALTGLFCERTAQVTAVELSEKRSRIIFHRCENATNLEVIAGNVMDVSFPKPFDYITLIGVLEYAGCFVEGPHPGKTMLKHISGMLAPRGCLIVAIENKFGLKYFAGAKEDHTGRSFEGIEGYSGSPMETFSKKELSDALLETGFSEIKFYYPYPDYKLPEELFSDDFPPDINHVLHNAPNYDRERMELFSEKKAFMNIIRNGHFDFFANSFLVLASRHRQPGND